MEDLARLAGLPLVTFDTMRLEHWERRQGKGLTEALNLAVKMARGDDSLSMLTFAGPPGVGKTHLAIAIAWDWRLAGAFVLYRQAEALLDEMRRTFDLTPGQALDMNLLTFDMVLTKFKKCHLLIIDDLGVEKPTEWAQARLDSIIDHRWLNQLPTVVTTNLKSEDLPPRIVDRLQDWRCSRVVQMSAASYRRGKSGGVAG